MIKIGIIKLGALGDVIRTIPIVTALKKKYPDSNIVWITKKESEEILIGNKKINKIEILPLKDKMEFDLLYNFDIDKESTEIAEKIKAKKKFGFRNNDGYLAAFNFGAEYYVNTVFDDNLKKDNKKTYQEMMFEAAELPYNKEKIEIFLSDKEKEYGSRFFKERGIPKYSVIGIHIGASPRWPSKVWAEEKINELISEGSKEGYKFIILAGPKDREKQKELHFKLMKRGIVAYMNDCNNTIKEFASIVSLCRAIVCADSFALHIAIAMKVPTIALFFCTSPNEIEGYGIVKKIVSPLIYKYFPQRQNEYSEELINSISAEQVLEEIKKIVKPK